MARARFRCSLGIVAGVLLVVSAADLPEHPQTLPPTEELDVLPHEVKSIKTLGPGNTLKPSRSVLPRHQHSPTSGASELSTTPWVHNQSYSDAKRRAGPIHGLQNDADADDSNSSASASFEFNEVSISRFELSIRRDTLQSSRLHLARCMPSRCLPSVWRNARTGHLSPPPSVGRSLPLSIRHPSHHQSSSPTEHSYRRWREKGTLRSSAVLLPLQRPLRCPLLLQQPRLPLPSRSTAH